jgi:uncharacterized damage-inducible protein DinB
MRSLTETLAGQAPRPRLEEGAQRRTPAELLGLLDEASQQLTAEARRLPLDQPVTRRTRDGRTLQMTRAAMLAHIATHGSHHRAQCLNMLRHLGVTPLPPSSVAEWTSMGDARL